MKKKIQYVLVNALGILGYVLPIGIALWRASTGRGVKGPARTTKHQEPKVQSAAEFESLSLSTPGDAPLDHLARIAADEKRKPPSPRDAFLAPREESVQDVLQWHELESARLPGWGEPKPDRLPVPSYAPAVMA